MQWTLLFYTFSPQMEQQRSQVFQVNCICCLPLYGGGGGGYPCKRQQYEHLKEKKKQAFIFRETVGVYDRNGRANLIPWGERN